MDAQQPEQYYVVIHKNFESLETTTHDKKKNRSSLKQALDLELKVLPLTPLKVCVP